MPFKTRLWDVAQSTTVTLLSLLDSYKIQFPVLGF